MITEDIDISWKLQLRHWDIFFEPRALCWILMPETLKGLWKQRLRWAQAARRCFWSTFAGLCAGSITACGPCFLSMPCQRCGPSPTR